MQHVLSHFAGFFFFSPPARQGFTRVIRGGPESTICLSHAGLKLAAIQTVGLQARATQFLALLVNSSTILVHRVSAQN